MTRLELLERVNTLNMRAAPGVKYWTCTVMYNTVIWRQCGTAEVEMIEVIKGEPS